MHDTTQHPARGGTLSRRCRSGVAALALALTAGIGALAPTAARASWLLDHLYEHIGLLQASFNPVVQAATLAGVIVVNHTGKELKIRPAGDDWAECKWTEKIANGQHGIIACVNSAMNLDRKSIAGFRLVSSIYTLARLEFANNHRLGEHDYFIRATDSSGIAVDDFSDDGKGHGRKHSLLWFAVGNTPTDALEKELGVKIPGEIKKAMEFGNKLTGMIPGLNGGNIVGTIIVKDASDWSVPKRAGAIFAKIGEQAAKRRHELVEWCGKETGAEGKCRTGLAALSDKEGDACRDPFDRDCTEAVRVMIPNIQCEVETGDKGGWGASKKYMDCYKKKHGERFAALVDGCEKATKLSEAVCKKGLDAIDDKGEKCTGYKLFWKTCGDAYRNAYMNR